MVKTAGPVEATGRTAGGGVHVWKRPRSAFRGRNSEHRPAKSSNRGLLCTHDPTAKMSCISRILDRPVLATYKQGVGGSSPSPPMA
jgi:hypothetical protein